MHFIRVQILFREGNGWSHERCRRLWSLISKPHLRYNSLAKWDAAMMQLQRDYGVLESSQSVSHHILKKHRVIVAERQPFVFLFNFSPSTDHANLSIPLHDPGTYQTVLDSDSAGFDGDGKRSDQEKDFCTTNNKNAVGLSDLSHPYCLHLSCAARSCLVLARL